MKCKGGFSLIEIITYLMIFTICIAISTSVYLETRMVYESVLKRNLELNSIKEGFLSINKISKEEQVVLIKASPNQVEFYKNIGENEYLLKVLKKKEEALIIEHYFINKEGILSAYSRDNNIISKVDDFKVFKKEKLIYISVIKDGEEYIKCI